MRFFRLGKICMCQIQMTEIQVSIGPEYSELALECRQKVKSRNYFAQVSNSTTKFLSVLVHNQHNRLEILGFHYI